MLKSWLRILYLTGLILTLTISTRSVFGQENRDLQWSSPQLLGNGWWESIAIDRQGNVHVGWYSSDPAFLEPEANIDVFNYRRRSPDGDWTEVNNVLYTGTGGYTIRNSLAPTSDGTLNLIFRGQTQHFFSNAYSLVANNARSWSPPIVIDDVGYYVDMIADRNDVLHVITSERLGDLSLETSGTHAELNPCALCHDLFYRRSTDGGQSWSTPFPISRNPTTGSDRIDVFEGRSGRLYIAWDEGYDWYIGRGNAQDVRLVYSEDSGLTWSEPIILDGGDFVDRKPITIAATELLDESLLVVWRYHTNIDQNIYYQLSTDLGKTWSTPQAIPGLVAESINEAILDDYELITDKLGTAHLFATGLPDVQTITNPSLYHITFRQGLWLPPQRVFYSGNMRPEWPRAVVGPQNELHLVWFIRGTGVNERGEALDSTDILKVYYSHLPGIFPLNTTPEFIPTRTPYPTATVFQNLASTTTPFPTIEAMASDVSVTSGDQYASQTLLGGLFATGIFCALIVLAIRIRRGG
jgi:hypothetical protein